jgi:hypothetical protein
MGTECCMLPMHLKLYCLFSVTNGYWMLHATNAPETVLPVLCYQWVLNAACYQCTWNCIACSLLPMGTECCMLPMHLKLYCLFSVTNGSTPRHTYVAALYYTFPLHHNVHTCCTLYCRSRSWEGYVTFGQQWSSQSSSDDTRYVHTQSPLPPFLICTPTLKFTNLCAIA